MRILTLLVLMGCVVVLANSASAQNDTPPHQQFNRFELDIGAVWSPSIGISGFPVWMRAIPLHHNRVSERDTLPDKTVMLHRTPGADVNFQFYPIRYFSVGAYICFYKETGGPDTPERYQENQGGGPGRGSGAALRYYQLNQSKKAWGWQRTLKTPWSGASQDLLHLRGVAGYRKNIGGLKLMAESGRDEWNSDKILHTMDIGTLYEDRFFIGFEIGYSEKPKKNQGYDIGLNFIYCYFMTHSTRIEPLDEFSSFTFHKIGKSVLMIGVGSTF